MPVSARGGNHFYTEDSQRSVEAVSSNRADSYHDCNFITSLTLKPSTQGIASAFFNDLTLGSDCRESGPLLAARYKLEANSNEHENEHEQSISCQSFLERDWA
ncbi:hypothetical protein BH23CYA1_BH23CYA1_16850 [soil metagenome]